MLKPFELGVFAGQIAYPGGGNRNSRLDRAIGICQFQSGFRFDGVTLLQQPREGSLGQLSADSGVDRLLRDNAHLDRSEGIAAVTARLDPTFKERRDTEFAGMQTTHLFVFKDYADTERLLDGLRKAGVP